MLEILEQRKLFAASVVNGVLTVTGTGSNDVIVIRLRFSDNMIEVNVNGAISAFELVAQSIASVALFGMAGDDRISVREAVAAVDGAPPDKAFVLPVSMNGGT